MGKFKSSKNPSDTKHKDKGPKLRFPFVGTPMPATCREIERYPLNAPFAYAAVAKDHTAALAVSVTAMAKTAPTTSVTAVLPADVARLRPAL